MVNMFCRKCLKQDRKVNMDVDIENGKYICPECKTEIEWHHEDEEN